jgi:hypothetical protein
MLKKSKTNALILSAFTCLAFALSSAVLNLLLPYLLSGDVHSIIEHPENLSTPAAMLTLFAILLFVLGLLIGSVAVYFYKFFGDAYYGLKGALRWVIFGILTALLIQLPIWLIPQVAILKTITQVLGVLIAFFLARWIIPLERKPS